MSVSDSFVSLVRESFATILNSEAYSVFVRFRLDGCSLVRTSDTVQDFKAKRVEGLKSTDVYRSYWEGGNETVCGVYDAQIPHMTETRDETDDYAKSEEKGACSSTCTESS